MSHAETTRNPKYQDRIYMHTFSITGIILQFATSDTPQKVNPDHRLNAFKHRLSTVAGTHRARCREIRYRFLAKSTPRMALRIAPTLLDNAGSNGIRRFMLGSLQEFQHPERTPLLPT